MLDFIQRLLSADTFMPHGHCYHWLPEIVWLHVVSDALVFASYTSIPFTLYYFVRRRRDLPYPWMFLCFAVFIVACGTTHLMEIVTLWNPLYRLSGVIKAVTAAASVPTAVLLVWLVPRALQIPSPEELRRANADLERAERELRRANTQLETTNAELEAFSYSVAHDLRAPLRAIHGFAALLAEDAVERLDTEKKDYLDEISGNAHRMSELIDALLGLSRVTRAPLRQEQADISALAVAVGERLARAEPEREVALSVAPGLEAEADPALIDVVFENLLSNARKFTSQSDAPRIEVGRELCASEVVFYVRDNGAGFDEARAERMFTAFQRFHTQTEFEGTGIGLATVKRIISRHGGRVWATGAVGGGATFYFTLPTLLAARAEAAQ